MRSPSLLLFCFLASTSAAAAGTQKTPQPTPITTTAWKYVPNLLDRHTAFFARVLNVSADRTTLGIQPASTSSSVTAYETTVTVGPDYYGEGLDMHIMDAPSATRSVVQVGHIDCAKKDGADADAACTVSQSPAFPVVVMCAAPDTPIIPPMPDEALARRAASSPPPEWCSGSASVTRTAEVVETFAAKAESFLVAQLTITDGAQMLLGTSSSAVSGASVATAKATEDRGAAGGTATENRGARVPVQTVGPVVAGLGVVVAFVV